MIEYFISGTTREGEVLPQEHGMTIVCIQQVLDTYITKYPNCIHACISMALPDLQLMAERRRNFLDGR